MPAKQRPKPFKRGKTWAVRYRDENGTERLRGGFATKTEAGEWVDRKVAEIEALRNGDVTTHRRQDMPTLQQLVDEYLAQHVCEENTLETLKARLTYATDTFGDVRLNRLAAPELRAWRSTLPPGSAWHIVKVGRQIGNYAVAIGLLDSNPFKQVPNPKPKRKEILSFATLAEVEAVSEELLKRYQAIPIVGCLTGLRPSELLALERRDIDRVKGLLNVRQVLIGGQFRPYAKTERSRRIVGLPARALEALEAHPARIDTPLLFSTKLGTPIDLHRFRGRQWTPALRAAGITHRSPYAMRHTYATWCIAARRQTYEIVRDMGTSLEQFDETYGHLLPDSAERGKAALDAFLTPSDAAEAGG
jgi:integrase